MATGRNYVLCGYFGISLALLNSTSSLCKLGLRKSVYVSMVRLWVKRSDANGFFFVYVCRKKNGLPANTIGYNSLQPHSIQPHDFRYDVRTLCS